MNAQGHVLLGVDIFDGRTTVDLRYRGPGVVADLVEVLGEAQGRDRLQMFTFLLCGGRMNDDGTYKSNSFRAVCKRMGEGRLIFDFARSCAVKTLDLKGNDIGNEGATALAGMLHTNTTLTTLDLNFNSIGNEEKAALREAWGGRTNNLHLG